MEKLSKTLALLSFLAATVAHADITLAYRCEQLNPAAGLGANMDSGTDVVAGLCENSANPGKYILYLSLGRNVGGYMNSPVAYPDSQTYPFKTLMLKKGIGVAATNSDGQTIDLKMTPLKGMYKGDFMGKLTVGEQSVQLYCAAGSSWGRDNTPSPTQCPPVW
jgi:hypothetical protein